MSRLLPLLPRTCPLRRRLSSQSNIPTTTRPPTLTPHQTPPAAAPAPPPPPPRAPHPPLTYASLDPALLRRLSYTEHYTLRKLIAHPDANAPHRLFHPTTDAAGYTHRPPFSLREQALLRKCALFLHLCPTTHFGLPPAPTRAPPKPLLPKLVQRRDAKLAKLDRLRSALEGMEQVLGVWKKEKVAEREKRRSMLPF